MNHLTVVLAILFTYVTVLKSQEISTHGICHIEPCGAEVMNNNNEICHADHPVAKCLEEKVLTNKTCQGEAKKKTVTAIALHNVKNEGVCAEESLKDGCPFEKCGAVVKIPGPQQCEAGRTFIECLEKQVLKDKDCKDTKKIKTETGVKSLKEQVKYHCGVIAINNGCDFTKSCGQNVEITSPKQCKTGKEFIDCLEKKVLTDETCQNATRTMTEQGIMGLKSIIDKFTCEKDSSGPESTAVSLAASVVTLLIMMITTHILAKF